MLLDLQFTSKGVCTALLQLIMAKRLAHSAEVMKVTQCTPVNHHPDELKSIQNAARAFLGHIENIFKAFAVHCS